jgi:CheY-like chemotaxis protein
MRRLRILIAEDDAMVGMLLAELLDEIGHEVCAITTTELATVSAAAQHQPDMLILDVGLGSGSGLSALTAILQLRPIPHIIMSGAAVMFPGSILRKPFREADLVRAIDFAMPDL